MNIPLIELDGRGLDSDTVALIADGAARVKPAPGALDVVASSWRMADELVATRRVYGRSTGVGANRTLDVAPGDLGLHGLRLLRSHAGGIGDPLPGRQVRAMLAVRLNQLLAGGAGLRVEVVEALAAAVEAGVHPLVNEYGAVGTGDLSALSQLGLALAGEHPWLMAADSGEGPRSAPPSPISLETSDALALISSNALTLGQAALARSAVDGLLRASHVVAGLSLLAVGGSLEAYAEPVHAARPHPGNVRAAAEVRRVVGAPDRPGPPTGRIQDPYAFRCFPQIHGPALEASEALERVLAIELNAGAENPLISADGPDGPAAYHHGGFYSAHLALALDQLSLATLPTARLSAARLSALAEPAITGLRPFLADEVSAGSGMLILEYSANAAIAEMRNAAAPASLGHAVLSRSVEEAASFASQASRQALRMVEAYRLVLGCELVAAVRALRQRDDVKKAEWSDLSLPAGRAYALADATLDPSMEDRPLTADVAAAAGLLGALAEL
ncbi:aromatic amino acid lyase [Planotetraspora sp. A-T 1434]|uniref:aromatic amino acid ammonia-lyase n=1 Tax=Planotetraspora sp. A-T 1434 TaxID=2979219 RepID=UPI0021BF7FF4|nr:aromatic amino acid ammonia-lyase [Planotetraspora sp. A-T 1434]MCT9929660.1 aromatic amino acid lyase [Planotetraspora sp. A-T 1434]